MSAISKLGVMIIGIAVLAAIAVVILAVAHRVDAKHGRFTSVLFIGPAVLLLSAGLIYPALRTIVLSLFSSSNAFVGLENYITVFGDPAMQRVLLNTIAWIVICPVVSTVIGLVYAVLADRIRWEVVAKTLIFLPMAISFVGASIIWKFMYEYRSNEQGVHQIGLLNQLIVWAGGEPVQFLTVDPWNNLFLMVVMIWIEAGFAMTILSAAIKGVPPEILESASLDGASGIQTFFRIIIPTIRPSLILVVTTITIAVLKVFDIVLTMTGGQFSTSVIANEYYAQAFRFFNTGLGAALAVVLFAFVVPIIAYNVRLFRGKVEA